MWRLLGQLACRALLPLPLVPTTRDAVSRASHRYDRRGRGRQRGDQWERRPTRGAQQLRADLPGRYPSENRSTAVYGNESDAGDRRHQRGRPVRRRRRHTRYSDQPTVSNDDCIYAYDACAMLRGGVRCARRVLAAPVFSVWGWLGAAGGSSGRRSRRSAAALRDCVRARHFLSPRRSGLAIRRRTRRVRRSRSQKGLIRIAFDLQVASREPGTLGVNFKQITESATGAQRPNVSQGDVTTTPAVRPCDVVSAGEIEPLSPPLSSWLKAPIAAPRGGARSPAEGDPTSYWPGRLATSTENPTVPVVSPCPSTRIST